MYCFTNLSHFVVNRRHKLEDAGMGVLQLLHIIKIPLDVVEQRHIILTKNKVYALQRFVEKIII